jgi:SAM-dependent methyltransferase
MRTLREAYVGQALDRRSGEHWSGPPQMVERIARAAGTKAGQVVVDVGCGLGGPARRLAVLTGCRVVGVDVLPDVVALAASRAAPRLAFLAASGDRLPLRDRAADQVWSLGAVAHVGDLGGFCAEAARVLGRPGTLALTEAVWDGRREPRFAHSAPRPWRPLPGDELTGALRAAGFEPVEVLPWPGEGLGGRPSDPLLAADLADGRLESVMVLARIG